MRVLSIFSILAGISAFPGNGTTSRHLRKASRRLIWDDDEGAGGTSFGESDPSDPWADVWAPEADFHGSDHVAAQNWRFNFAMGKFFNLFVKEKVRPATDTLQSVVSSYNKFASSCDGLWLSLMVGCTPGVGTAVGVTSALAHIIEEKSKGECKAAQDSLMICKPTADSALQNSLAVGGEIKWAGAAASGAMACLYGTALTLSDMQGTCASSHKNAPTCAEMVLVYHTMEGVFVNWGKSPVPGRELGKIDWKNSMKGMRFADILRRLIESETCQLLAENSDTYGECFRSLPKKNPETNTNTICKISKYTLKYACPRWKLGVYGLRSYSRCLAAKLSDPCIEKVLRITAHYREGAMTIEKKSGDVKMSPAYQRKMKHCDRPV